MAGLIERRARRQATFRWVVLLVLGVFFLLPMVAMVEFTTRGDTGTWSLLVNWPQLSETYPDLAEGIVASRGQAALTALLMLVLLVPTAIWVRLRLPGLRRFVEFICLLPLTIPAIVLVVGLAPVYAWVNYLIGGSSLTLTFAYTVLVLPNIRSAVLSAAFLSVALVLGEFTIASLLNRTNLQVAINFLGKSSATMSVAVSLAALLLAFVLLLLLSLIGDRKKKVKA